MDGWIGGREGEGDMKCLVHFFYCDIGAGTVLVLLFNIIFLFGYGVWDGLI